MDQDQFSVDIGQNQVIEALTWLIPFLVVFVGAVMQMTVLLQAGGLLVIARAIHYYYTEF